MTKEILEVRGERLMSCSGCERTVTFSLSPLPGVKVLDVDHRTQRIDLMLSGETSLDAIQSELSSIGYKTISKSCL